MKRVLAALAVIASLAAFAHAGTPFSVEIGTYAVTDAAYIGAQISGTVDISNITFSNSGATAQTVSIYKLGASTTTVTALMTFVLPAAAGFYQPFGDLDFNDRIHVTDACFRKSATATSVYVTGIYQ